MGNLYSSAFLIKKYFHPQNFFEAEKKILWINLFFSFKKNSKDENMFLSKKACEYKLSIIFRYFFLHFQYFYTIEFFFELPKINFVGKFFSNLLQNEHKNAIFNLKTKKNKTLSIEFFFQFQKKNSMDENIFLSKKAGEYKFPIIFRYFFLHFQHFLTIEFFF